MNTTSAQGRQPAFQARMLNHVTLEVQDLDRSVAFYQRLFGMPLQSDQVVSPRRVPVPSLIEPPPKSDFPGTGPEGNGISPRMTSQAAWVDHMKQGCQLCHQLGNAATRVVRQRDEFDSTVAAWDHRVQTGQRGNTMNAFMSQFGRQRALAMFADWTDRIAAGEVPHPSRPARRAWNATSW